MPDTTGTPQTAVPVPAQTYLSGEWPVWGTTIHLVVAGDDLHDARRCAVAVLDAVDRTCSRFRDDSDLVRANAAAGEWVAVDPLLVEVVRAALQAAATTRGLVDPTLGVVLRSWGYDTDFSRLDTASVDPADPVRGVGVAVDIQSVASGPVEPSGLGTTGHDLAEPGNPGRPWQGIDIDDGQVGGNARIRVPAGVALDLGAIGKAYAVDAVAAALGGAGIAGIVGIGGDVAVTPGAATGHTWRVDIREVPGGPVQQRLEILTGAIATSATSHRRWRHRGGIAHHIIDPRTGCPAAEVWRTVSVAAASAVDANTASTAAVVMGGGAPAWLSGHGLAARLVGTDATVVTTGGWPGPDQA